MLDPPASGVNALMLFLSSNYAGVVYVAICSLVPASTQFIIEKKNP